MWYLIQICVSETRYSADKRLYAGRFTEWVLRSLSGPEMIPGPFIHSVSDNNRTDGPFSTEPTVRSLIITTAHATYTEAKVDVTQEIEQRAQWSAPAWAVCYHCLVFLK